jgi:hypothetical protein
MRILEVIKDYLMWDAVRTGLAELAEPDSIFIVFSYTEAADFLENNIIKHQSALDLIIIQNNIEGRSGADFYESFTEDKTTTYSNRDFYLNRIPVVLIADKEENKNAFLSHGFALVLDNIGLEKLHLFNVDFVNVVKDWRRQVLDELDNLGIKFNSGRIDYRNIPSGAKRIGVHTRILTENFKQFQRRLNYPWILANERQIEIAIDNYIRELKRARRNGAKREEKRFHALFNKYPFLIERDNYSEHWYEAALNYEEGRLFKPDYSLKPNFNQRADLSILEVKLPNESFLAKSPFHPGPLQNLMHHIFQVKDYKDILEDDQHQQKIETAFGFVPNKVEYNILMGSIDEKTNSLPILNKRMQQIDATNINLLTYDELLDYQVKYLDRIKTLKIV